MKTRLPVAMAVTAIGILGAAVPAVAAPAAPANLTERSSAAAVSPTAAAATAPVDASAQVTCWAEARRPVYRNGRVYAQAVAHCSQQQGTLEIKVRLTRDGETAATSRDTCSNATACHETTSAPNRAGNQLWCTHASMNPTGDTAIACEYSGFGGVGRAV